MNGVTAVEAIVTGTEGRVDLCGGQSGQQPEAILRSGGSSVLAKPTHGSRLET